MFGFMRSGPRVERIAPKDAVARVAAGAAVLIDVREQAEVAQSGIAAGALHVPLGQIMQKCDLAKPAFPVLAEGKPIILYCASGGRSQRAGEALKAMGYGEVYNLGGLSDWVSGGGKVTR